MYFEDGNRQLSLRRKRLGLKGIMRHVFEEGTFQKNCFMLSNCDQLLLTTNDRLILDYQLSVFPKNKEEMLSSPYFCISSQLAKYRILDQTAIPIPDVEFNEERVYLRKDIIAVTSRLFWVDRGRMVKPDEQAVKKTENKSKNITELFLYEQTEPFQLSVNPETGDFKADDEFNSIYVPQDFRPAPEMVIIDQKVGMVCSRAKIQHVKVVQGFTHSMGRVLPNEVGYLVYRKD